MIGFHFDSASPTSLVRLGVGLVWVTFGLVFEVLNAVPRHRQVVARIGGERLAPILTPLVGVGECALGVWMWSGLWTPACVAVQAVGVVAMNTLELILARDLLLSPRLMLLANASLISAGLYVGMSPR